MSLSPSQPSSTRRCVCVLSLPCVRHLTLCIQPDTAVHQGGGQPSDRGFVIWDASSSDKSRVAPRTSSSTVVFQVRGIGHSALCVVLQLLISLLAAAPLWHQVAHARVAPDGSGAVLHYGKLLHSVPAGVALDPDTTSMPEAPAGSATGTVQRIPKAAVVTQYVSPKLRMTHAALHSAGHLLDKVSQQAVSWAPMHA